MTSGSQSRLGNVEVRDAVRLSSVRFKFTELPDVEPESARLLANLPGAASIS